TDVQFLGQINSDPLFGKTEAEIYLELKPAAYPFTFKNKPNLDSLFLDSVVLILDYDETYGDSSVSQTVNVSEITGDFRSDTSFFLRSNSHISVSSGTLGSTTFIPHTLNDSVKAYLDTTTNQLRIRLDNSFGNRLLLYDTTGANNAYSSDSAFKTRFKGFALKSVAGGDAIMGFDLQGVGTKLAIYYRYLHGAGTDQDTTVAYFNFKDRGTYGPNASASHNYIKRDYSGSDLAAAQGGTSPDALIYIQNTPGSFAIIKTPDLKTLSNRVVHRAELIAEQVYHPTDTLFPVPTFLYMDAFNAAKSDYQNIPYDVVYNSSNGAFNLNGFGVAPINALDGSGRVVKTWHFNLTRYIQHVVNKTDSVRDLRLFAPYYVRDIYVAPAIGAEPIAAYSAPIVYVNPSLVKGRVRLAGGTTGPQQMRIRIIYSKI
ncbi:MAG TPA: DUF4270 family protein, partial [Chitinophagaceae bacterium]|nr:DUF4270 family protein [Chitinophagaceae bacterium]